MPRKGTAKNDSENCSGICQNQWGKYRANGLIRPVLPESSNPSPVPVYSPTILKGVIAGKRIPRKNVGSSSSMTCFSDWNHSKHSWILRRLQSSVHCTPSAPTFLSKHCFAIFNYARQMTCMRASNLLQLEWQLNRAKQNKTDGRTPNTTAFSLLGRFVSVEPAEGYGTTARSRGSQ